MSGTSGDYAVVPGRLLLGGLAVQNAPTWGLRMRCALSECFSSLRSRRRAALVACATAVVLTVVCARTKLQFFNDFGGPSEAARLRNERDAVTGLWVHSFEAKFKRITHGTCADIGMSPIVDLFHCQYAADELDLSDTTPLTTAFPDIPEGCYYFQDTKAHIEDLWFGINKSNIGMGAETSDLPAGKRRYPLCMSKPTTLTVSTTRARPTITTTRPKSATNAKTQSTTPTSTHSPPSSVHTSSSHRSTPRSTTTSTTTQTTTTDTTTAAGSTTTNVTTTAAPTAITSTTTQVPKVHVLKGISYAPVPLKHARVLGNDDFMSSNASALWGSGGRGDLAIMKALGANAVRLYGNDPTQQHGQFLDEATSQGLEVILGMSDYPFVQMDGNCLTTDFDCFKQIRNAYALNLRNGFLTSGKRYHSALRTVILMNEPDLKFQPITEPSHFCKALISAFDAVLAAEEEAGVVGPRPNFTVTFSFGVCGNCKEFGLRPALGQMAELRSAMKNPGSIGYNSGRDLWAAYQQRFVNSFNTANPAVDVRHLFLDIYDSEFLGTPVFIGEYHSPGVPDQRKDLDRILVEAANASSLLMGISFFEFQIRYDKGGSELEFGMFGLGAENGQSIQMGDSTFKVRCLAPVSPPVDVQADELNKKCGLIEHNWDYFINSVWKLNLEAIPSVDLCCTHCKEAPQCLSWSWILATHQCFLFGARPVTTERVSKAGVVSGFPPPRSMTWKESPSSSVSSRHDGKLNALVPAAVAQSFGGPGIKPGTDHAKLCPATAIVFYMEN